MEGFFRSEEPRHGGGKSKWGTRKIKTRGFYCEGGNKEFYRRKIWLASRAGRDPLWEEIYGV